MAEELDLKREAPWVLIYFALYFGYLWLTLEDEVRHWATLVIIPFAVLAWLQRNRMGHWEIKQSLTTVGLRKPMWTQSSFWALVIGILLSSLQLVLSRNKAQIWHLLVSGKGVPLFLLAFVLMVLTAGFTDEFFFRGVLQTRLQALFKSKVVAVLVASILFGLYHLPYAYLHPRWPSHGNWPDAFGAAFGQAVPMGLILGTVYARSGNNLIPAVIVHSLFDTLPAMASLHIGRT